MCLFVRTNEVVRETISQLIWFVEQTKSLAKNGERIELIREVFGEGWRTGPNFAGFKFWQLSANICKYFENVGKRSKMLANLCKSWETNVGELVGNELAK